MIIVHNSAEPGKDWEHCVIIVHNSAETGKCWELCTKHFAFVQVCICEFECCTYVTGMKTYNKCKWKGHELQIQLAKESFLDKYVLLP